MIKFISLIMPIILPSWRFFDWIGPSPRIEIRKDSALNNVNPWHTFMPKPERISIGQMICHMVWNPHRNEALFLASLSERLMHGEEEFAREEIFHRIIAKTPQCQSIEFRLVFHYREGTTLKSHVTYTSPIRHVQPEEP